jgi:hypothetical protein
MGGSLLDDETRPGQSSAAQAQDAGLVRLLCVAREGAYRTSHEPPTADPHGGWCGGRRLAAVAYPIGRHGDGPRLAMKRSLHWPRLLALESIDLGAHRPKPSRSSSSLRES